MTNPPDDRPTAESRPYQPRGAAVSVLYSHDPEVIVSGPAGTGKSRACLEKLFLCVNKYPATRALIIRKTRESLSETALVTWETKVVPARHPCLIGPQRRLRQHYAFSNGSEIIVGGLDKTSKVMSSEYDLIFVQEATELAESEWEALTTRLRNGKMPYQQLLADCNPGAPTHWLKQRANKGATKLLESRHEDNPEIWDEATGKYTAKGADYIAKLDALTGPRKPRLRHGIWAQAEGVVYTGWDPREHLVDRFNVPHDWPRYWVIDFGYTTPFVWQEWAADHDGRLFLIREIYHTKGLVEDHAKRISELTLGSPRPRLIICDHDAEDRATLERHLRMSTEAAQKAVSIGIQEVQKRLEFAGDSRARLFIMRDAVVARDPDLVAASKPACTAEEFDSYIWDVGAGRKGGEEPMKRDDHGLDATRYLCMHIASNDTGPQEYGSPKPSHQPLAGLPAGTFG